MLKKNFYNGLKMCKNIQKKNHDFLFFENRDFSFFELKNKPNNISDNKKHKFYSENLFRKTLPRLLKSIYPFSCFQNFMVRASQFKQK